MQYLTEFEFVKDSKLPPEISFFQLCRKPFSRAVSVPINRISEGLSKYWSFVNGKYFKMVVTIWIHFALWFLGAFILLFRGSIYVGRLAIEKRWQLKISVWERILIIWSSYLGFSMGILTASCNRLRCSMVQLLRRRHSSLPHPSQLQSHKKTTLHQPLLPERFQSVPFCKWGM